MCAVYASDITLNRTPRRQHNMSDKIALSDVMLFI